MKSLTQRSVEKLQEEGYVVSVVEHYDKRSRKRFDAFGCIDIIAVHPDNNGTLYVQTTSKGHISDRVKKVSGQVSFMDACLRAGNRIVIHGWFTDMLGLWCCKEREIKEWKTKIS